LELVLSGSGTRSSEMLMANLKATSIHIMRLGENPYPKGSKRHMGMLSDNARTVIRRDHCFHSAQITDADQIDAERLCTVHNHCSS